MLQKMGYWFWIVFLLTSASVSSFSLPRNRFRRKISDTNDNSLKYFAAAFWEIEMFAPKYNEPQNRICGGVIIDKHHVLTAAHCFADYVNYVSTFPTQAPPHTGYWQAWVFYGNFSQQLGPLDKNMYAEKFQHFPVKSVTVHESFLRNDTHYLHDIAILRVDGTFSLDMILPLCKSEDLKEGDVDNKFLLSGIGKDANKNPAETLKYLTVTEDRDGFCDSVDVTQTTPGSYICVKGSSACYGDSGGPLAYLDQETGRPTCLYGIVSHQVGPNTGPAAMKFMINGTMVRSLCSLAEGVRYSSMLYYTAWIEEKLKQVS